MKTVSNRTTLKIIGIYVIASLLLAACGNKRERADIKVGKPSGAVGPDISKLQTTGKENSFGEKYIYLGDSKTAGAAKSAILSVLALSDEASGKAMELSARIASFNIVPQKDGYVAKLEVGSDAEKEDAKNEQITIELTGAEVGNSLQLKGEAGGYQVEASCSDVNCHLGTVVLKNKAGVKIPYIVEVRKIRANSVAPQFDPKSTKFEMVTVEKQKHLMLADLISGANQEKALAAISNTINLLTDESQFAVSLESTVGGKDKSLQISGPFVMLEQEANQSDLTVEVSPKIKGHTAVEVRRKSVGEKVMSFVIQAQGSQPEEVVDGKVPTPSKLDRTTITFSISIVDTQ